MQTKRLLHQNSMFRSQQYNYTRDAEQYQDYGNSINHKFSCHAKQFSAMKQPNSTEYRHLAVIILRSRKLYALECCIWRQRHVSKGTAKHHKSVAMRSYIGQLFVVFQRHLHLIPFTMHSISVYSERRYRPKTAFCCLYYISYLAIVSAYRQSVIEVIEVIEARSLGIGEPYSSIAVKQQTMRRSLHNQRVFYKGFVKIERSS